MSRFIQYRLKFLRSLAKKIVCQTNITLRMKVEAMDDSCSCQARLRGIVFHRAFPALRVRELADPPWMVDAVVHLAQHRSPESALGFAKGLNMCGNSSILAGWSRQGGW
jgi:hypothetical protein